MLADAGYTPVIFDNLEAGNREAVQGYELIEGDLRDLVHIDNAIKTVKPAAVVHFAAYLDVGESVREPLKYFDNNVHGSLNLFQAMIANNVKRLIFSSTCATYGQPDALPVTEQEKATVAIPRSWSQFHTPALL